MESQAIQGCGPFPPDPGSREGHPAPSPWNPANGLSLAEHVRRSAVWPATSVAGGALLALAHHTGWWPVWFVLIGLVGLAAHAAWSHRRHDAAYPVRTGTGAPALSLAGSAGSATPGSATPDSATPDSAAPGSADVSEAHSPTGAGGPLSSDPTHLH